jgi:predicted HD phosphohydrolase
MCRVLRRRPKVCASLALSDEALVAAAWLHDVGYAPESQIRDFTHWTVLAIS